MICVGAGLPNFSETRLLLNSFESCFTTNAWFYVTRYIPAAILCFAGNFCVNLADAMLIGETCKKCAALSLES